MNTKKILCLATFATATVVCTQNVHSSQHCSQTDIDINNFTKKSDFVNIVRSISEQSFTHHINNISAVYALSPQEVQNKYFWINNKFYHQSIYNVINKIISSALSNTEDDIMKISDGIYIPKGFRLKDLSVSHWNYTIMYNFIRSYLLPLLNRKPISNNKYSNFPYKGSDADNRQYQSLWDVDTCTKKLAEIVKNIQHTFIFNDDITAKVNKAKDDCIKYAMATRLGQYITAQNVITLSEIHRPWAVYTQHPGYTFGALITTTKDLLHFNRPINIGCQSDTMGRTYNDIVLSTPYVSSYINMEEASTKGYDIRLVETYCVPLYATFILIPTKSRTTSADFNTKQFKEVIDTRMIDNPYFNPRLDALGSISSFYEGDMSYPVSPLMRVIDIKYDKEQKPTLQDIKSYVNMDRMHLNIWNCQDTLNGFEEAKQYIENEVKKYESKENKKTHNYTTTNKDVQNKFADARDDNSKITLYKSIISQYRA